ERDLAVVTIRLMAQDLDVAAFQAASADRTEEEPGPVADELDDAHRQAHITPRVLANIRLPPTLDAGAAMGPDHGRVQRARGKHHSVAGLQLEPVSLLLQEESDRAVDTVENLLVSVAVCPITIVR